MLENSIDRSRRNFLRGRFRKPEQDISRNTPLLPWVKAENFYSQCTRCDKCISACGEGILNRSDGRFPEIDFQLGKCTFCGECGSACNEDLFESREMRPRDSKAVISDSCIALQGISCQSCRDNCDSLAIRFLPKLGGASTPEVLLEDCSGCGACVAPCPVTAITVENTETLMGTSPEGPKERKARND